MKKQLIFLLMLAFGVVGWGQERPQAQITFKVIDDEGNPVPEVTMSMSTFHHWQPGEGFGKDISETFTGITDKNGSVTLSGQSLRGSFSYGPREKAGYYGGGTASADCPFQFKGKADGKWQPWNPAIEIKVKRILNPIPMYARKIGGGLPFKLPKTGEPIGFDLMVSDWVSPYGKGKTADLIFTLERHFTSVDKPYDASLTVTFSNDGDGIQPFVAPPFFGSALKLPRYAPEEEYQSKLVKQTSRLASDKPIDSGNREDQNYFFRVRTVKEAGKDGKIISAYYGKIDRDIAFDIINSDTAFILFTYYLNPTANDRNMEFDPKQNLLKGLPRLERPIAP